MSVDLTSLDLGLKSHSRQVSTVSVRLKDNLENEESADFSKFTGCELCLKKVSKYTCPRCNVKYCSLECYRGRNHVKCSEMFYKSCVMESLHGQTVENAEQRKMVEILKRFENEKEKESFDEFGSASFVGENLEERLKGLDLDHDYEKIWEKLTAEEQKEFERALNDGYIGTLVDTWIPWWTAADESGNEPIDSKTSKLPRLLKNIPDLNCLTKSKPVSNQIKFNVVNILYSYAYVCQHYNGCLDEFAVEAVENIWHLSVVLDHAINFESLDSALKSSVIASQQNKQLFHSKEFSISIIDDVLLLLKNNKKACFVSLAFSDVHRLLAKALKMKNSWSCRNLDSKQFWFGKKKIMFMLCWVRENKKELSLLVPFFKMVKETINLDHKLMQEDKEKMENYRWKNSRKKLIEEIG